MSAILMHPTTAAKRAAQRLQEAPGHNREIFLFYLMGWLESLEEDGRLQKSTIEGIEAAGLVARCACCGEEFEAEQLQEIDGDDYCASCAEDREEQ